MPNLQITNNLSSTEQYISDGTNNSNLAIGNAGRVGGMVTGNCAAVESARNIK
jgi:hypothetical protein